MQEPSVQVFHRRTAANRLQAYVAATRPAFLSASVLPVLAAGALSRHMQGAIDIPLLLLACVAVALIHSGANVANDYFDSRNGTDDSNTERVYPFTGGSRFIQNGVLTAPEMRDFAAVLLGGGALCGMVAVWFTGPLLLAMGIFGGLLAVCYSAPPCLVCHGLGDAVVAIAAGLLPVVGTTLMLTGELSAAAAWAGASIGCFVAAILWANSIPDIAADRLAGKWTIPARLGPRLASLLLPAWFVAGFLLLLPARLPPPLALIALAAMLPAGIATRALLQGRTAAALPMVIATQVVFCVLLIVGLLMA